MKNLFNILFVFRKKVRVIVGLTTYYNENLMISMSGLSRLRGDCVLIIHNDNPDTKVSYQQIRDMGYKGKLYIINSEYNTGLLNSRLSIINFVKQHDIRADWFIFVDDDDILLNIDIPNITEKHFAVIQNMLVIRTRIVDVLRAIQNPASISCDEENVYTVRPHIGMAGTLIRKDILLRFATVLHDALPVISDIDESLGFRPPVDIAMWSAMNIIAHDINPDSTPIYMDTVNYIATDVDTAPVKYGLPIQPKKNPKQQIIAAIAKYDAAVRAVLGTDNNSAAPAGQKTESE